MTAPFVILAEIDMVSPVGVATTLRFSDQPIRPFAPTEPGASNLAYDERIVEAPALKRSLFDDLASLSPGLGYGEMALVNADRALDAYKAHAWGELRVFRWTEGTPRAAAEPVLKGLCGQPGFPVTTKEPGRVRVPLWDYRAELEKPLQEVVYAGTNGTGGVLYEGAVDGLKGRRKPLAWGDLTDAHVPAPQVNAGVLAYQPAAMAVAGPISIFDRGAPAGFVSDGDYAGAAFDAHAPAAAHSATDLARGLVKLNGQTVGQVAFGLKGASAGGYVETTGPVLARLLAQAGVPAGRIGASVAALASPAVVGAWFETEDARTAVGWVARSAPAALLPSRLGVWEAYLFGPPAAVADLKIADDEILDLEEDGTAPAPAGEIRVGWGRIYTGYRQADLAPALTGTEAVERLTSDYRWAVIEDATVKARHPRTWRKIEITTALRRQADAQALAARLQGMFGLSPAGEPRRMLRVTVELTAERLAAGLGQTVEIAGGELGAGGRFVLLGEEPMRPRRDLVVWTLWG
ncbi:hypothetical protein [Brevundimonas aurantiaca]|jgi:hypothetical protein|uniref:hypothetical protein n=1 Tax=Brevundimonas aurantiaca TaxID=74316 RepID=UPI002FDDF7DB